MSETREIPVYSRAGVVAHVTVDADDFEWLNERRWTLADGYAVTCHEGRTTAMHRLILGLQRGDGRVAHHINEEKLDNRRQNLQVFASASEHGMAPHPKKDARILETMRELVAANPGWPYHEGSLLAKRRAARRAA